LTAEWNVNAKSFGFFPSVSLSKNRFSGYVVFAASLDAGSRLKDQSVFSIKRFQIASAFCMDI
jgi:hypothetical protein